jgi:hypothetical protein
MPKMDKSLLGPESGSEQILASLEPDQLAQSKHHFPRRSLKGAETVILWSLRLYLIFMLVVVLYQIWAGAR